LSKLRKLFTLKIMDINLQTTNLDYLEEISGGDNSFKKELIQIFLSQIPEFVQNMNKFLAEKNLPDLAKEAHTAKSSVLIFRMEETGKLLKNIQLTAENNQTGPIAEMIRAVETDMQNAAKELTEIINGM